MAPKGRAGAAKAKAAAAKAKVAAAVAAKATAAVIAKGPRRSWLHRRHSGLCQGRVLWPGPRPARRQLEPRRGHYAQPEQRAQPRLLDSLGSADSALSCGACPASVGLRREEAWASLAAPLGHWQARQSALQRRKLQADEDAAEALLREACWAHREAARSPRCLEPPGRLLAFHRPCQEPGSAHQCWEVLDQAPESSCLEEAW